MLDFGFYNMDCMEGMKQFPDKYFDLAIVDPPYGVSVTSQNVVEGGVTIGIGKCANPKVYHPFDDTSIPEKEYFDELFRISKMQIIWGGTSSLITLDPLNVFSFGIKVAEIYASQIVRSHGHR